LVGGRARAPEGGQLVGQLLHLLRRLLHGRLHVGQLLLLLLLRLLLLLLLRCRLLRLGGLGRLRQQRPQLLQLLRQRGRDGGRHLLPQLGDVRVGLVDLRRVWRPAGRPVRRAGQAALRQVGRQRRPLLWGRCCKPDGAHRPPAP
jgi:hypothetical protein